ncbi:hypothetical protein BRADI_4g28700v3 [Brachypodium distachyon]|uniref:Uncharacterized protein n=1 Tax=Brachypodium distachyon TaxID=15368 RepID=A0A0Q3HPC8_BRADI|nr:hypothetical protein BRADI_4g28700v3 [Brachypodium distachyon]
MEICGTASAAHPRPSRFLCPADDAARKGGVRASTGAWTGRTGGGGQRGSGVRYMQKNMQQSVLKCCHLFWARGPDTSRSHETAFFFCDGGDYDSYYGRFFLNWYSRILVDHVVLSLATLAFDGAEIVV